MPPDGSFETMQPEGEGLLVKPQHLDLHRALWQRQQEALHKASPEAQAAEEAAFQAAKAGLEDLKVQPEWVRGAELYPHQLEVPLPVPPSIFDPLSMSPPFHLTV